MKGMARLRCARRRPTLHPTTQALSSTRYGRIEAPSNPIATQARKRRAERSRRHLASIKDLKQSLGGQQLQEPLVMPRTT